MWTVLDAGKRLPRAVAARLRLALRLHDGRTLAGIDPPVLTILRTGDEHRVVGHLGPDLLGASTATDAGLAVAVGNVGAAGPQPVVAALLDQRRVAGLGNMWAQELLFLHGVEPWRPASATDPSPLLPGCAPQAARRRRPRPVAEHDRPPFPAALGLRAGAPSLPAVRHPDRLHEAARTPHGRETWWCPGCQR